MPKRRGYAFKKFLIDAGVQHGARHAYRPPGRPLEPREAVMNDEDLRVHRNVFWYGAALTYATAGAVPLAALLLHELAPGLEIPADLISPLTAVLSAIALAFAGFWVLMARRGAHALPWMNAIVGAGATLVALAALTSEQYGPDMLSCLLIPAMAAAFFMSFKQAAGHLAAIGMVMIYVSATSSNVPYGSTIALNIFFFTLLSAAMLVIVRKRIQDGVRQNIALAGRDPLTGVANLRKFNERLQSEIDRAERSGEPLTLLMIDLDDFKLVNDEHSYTLGDAVLVASARTINRVVRGHELLARRGGDEFAVIAVGAGVQDADALATRVKNVVRRERLRLCPGVSPEVSVGIAQWRPGETVATIMRRSDSALSVSKMLAHAEEPFSET